MIIMHQSLALNLLQSLLTWFASSPRSIRHHHHLSPQTQKKGMEFLVAIWLKTARPTIPWKMAVKTTRCPQRQALWALPPESLTDIQLHTPLTSTMITIPPHLHILHLPTKTWQHWHPNLPQTQTWQPQHPQLHFTWQPCYPLLHLEP